MNKNQCRNNPHWKSSVKENGIINVCGNCSDKEDCDSWKIMENK